jgi:alpha-beta hydrolase superfamily lysophospholipase
VPRKTPRSNRDDEGVVKSGDVELGWRLYVRSSGGDPSHPVVFYCHANAETAADVEHLAPLLHSAGAAAVFAVDYRGYGWSTGTPSFGTLLKDIEAVLAALPDILSRFGLGGRPLVAYGRSLGAACAVHAASTLPVRSARVLLCSPREAGDDRRVLLRGALLCAPSERE